MLLFKASSAAEADGLEALLGICFGEALEGFLAEEGAMLVDE